MAVPHKVNAKAQESSYSTTTLRMSGRAQQSARGLGVASESFFVFDVGAEGVIWSGFVDINEIFICKLQTYTVCSSIDTFWVVSKENGEVLGKVSFVK